MSRVCVSGCQACRVVLSSNEVVATYDWVVNSYMEKSKLVYRHEGNK